MHRPELRWLRRGLIAVSLTGLSLGVASLTDAHGGDPTKVHSGRLRNIQPGKPPVVSLG